jgi:hypothetical protein
MVPAKSVQANANIAAATKKACLNFICSPLSMICGEYVNVMPRCLVLIFSEAVTDRFAAESDFSTVDWQSSDFGSTSNRAFVY